MAGRQRFTGGPGRMAVGNGARRGAEAAVGGGAPTGGAGGDRLACGGLARSRVARRCPAERATATMTVLFTAGSRPGAEPRP